MADITSDFLIFLATIDPVGTLALFVGLTAGVSAQERTRVAFRAIGYSAVILLVFVLIGQVVLGSLGIRLESFQLAGGIIFFLFGVQMVFGTGAASAGSKSEPGHDVAAFPLAVPSIASPGSILAAVILTDNREFSFGEQAITALLLMAVLGLTLLLLLQANRIYAWIGDAGSALMVRVLGLVLAALAVEMILGAGAELWRETFLEISGALRPPRRIFLLSRWRKSPHAQAPGFEPETVHPGSACTSRSRGGGNGKVLQGFFGFPVGFWKRGLRRGLAG